MSQLPRYESYKDSGVQWLGEIPNHWNVKQLKFAVTCNDEALGENTELDYEILYVDISSVSLTDGIKHKEELLFENAPSRARRVVKSGDVLVSTVRTYLKAITYVESAEENLIASTGFAVLRPSEKFDSKFIGYWIQSEGMVGNIVANSVGVSYPAINSTDLVRLPIVELPLSEQKFIADFLDKRLAQVDALIAKQETLLEKLAEQRVALISHAVTKGLNPDVEMKESGIEILGNIPQQWKIKRLKFLLSEKLKYGANESAESEDKENPRYIRITDIDDSGNLKDETFKSLEFEKAEEYLLDDLDILLARSGATVGKSYLYKAESIGIACYAGYLIRARLDQENYNPEFVNYFLQSKQYWDWISSINIQATIQNVSAEKYNDLTLAIPPLEEQKQLIEYLKNEDEKFNSAIGKGKKLVHLLNEYRSTLITQVVTGKIDVRNIKVN
ncbi:restriction endonuclease subunit S [Acinetobacter baumannii]|uniref:restriction endonuclease subunit S n=1 Tax=Acinetobacter calcoaceticus/baumannii complex TaxID=909768 RepID=UPI00244C4D5F|nr:restriction endonuclease subunit S [Acinetobacter baumannii]MDH2667659.1 restriction endonuclease subunit S [Acinetobacter baumannii]